MIPGLGRSPEGGHGNPLQYSCLENPVDRGLQSIGSQKSDATEVTQRARMHALYAFSVCYKLNATNDMSTL